MFVPLTPIRCLYRAVDLYGSKVGIISGEQRFTYAEFGQRCECLAFGLKQQGIQRGERVAFLSFNTHQLLEGYFGPVLATGHCHAAECSLDPIGIDRDPESR